MVIRKWRAITIGVSVLLVLMTVVGLFAINLSQPRAETPVSNCSETTIWGDKYDEAFNGDSDVWKVFGKSYSSSSGSAFTTAGLSNVVPKNSRSYYSSSASNGNYFYAADSRAFGMAQFYANGKRVYCFDYFTAFDPDNLSLYPSLSAAGIPTNIISEESIMNVAKAVAVLQKNNWAYLKSIAGDIAKDATWDDSRLAGKLYKNGDRIKASGNTIAKADVEKMLRSSSTAGDTAREYLTQWMIWDILNNWYVNRNTSDSDRTFTPAGSGGTDDGKGGGGTASSMSYGTLIVWDRIIDFKTMYEKALDEFNNGSGEYANEWHRAYHLMPGEKKVITGDEATNFIATYDAAGSAERLWAGSSSAVKIDIDRNASKVTLTGGYIAGKYEKTSAKYATSSSMIYSTRGGSYKGNTDGFGINHTRGGAQFVVDATSVVKRWVSITVEPADGYVTVHKSFPSGRNPEGAVYTVYGNAGCTESLGTLTIKSNGDATAPLKVRLGNSGEKTVWIKETGLPNKDTSTDWHWVADSKTYSIKLTVSNQIDNPGRVNSTDTVKPNFGYVQVFKTVLKTEPCSGNVYSPAGAVYGIFTDKGCTQKLGQVTIGADGYSEKFKVVWTRDQTYKDVWIKELTSPPLPNPNTEWELDETVYNARVVAHETSIKPEDQPVQIIRSADPIIEYGYLRVRKTTQSAYADVVKDNSLYSVGHTRFRVKAVTGKLAGSTIGEYETHDDGWIDAIRVPVGRYEVEEIVAPAGHKLDVVNTYEIDVVIDTTAETPVVHVFANRPVADPFAIDFDKEWSKRE